MLDAEGLVIDETDGSKSDGSKSDELDDVNDAKSKGDTEV